VYKRQEVNISEIYPNPNNGIFKIHFESEDLASDNIIVEIYDVTGKRVENVSLKMINGKIDTDYNGRKLNPGVYFIGIKSRNKSSYQKMIVIK
jgi:hypothetical protein